MEERLQKILARAGLGSRRACEDFITAGRVTVNGQVAELGGKADPETDRIMLDGRPVSAPEAPVYIMLYKPRGVLSAVTAPDPRPTVRDLVEAPGHLFPVGRLDVDSEGLILLTNDGELANRLTHPRYGHEKEYKVLVARRPDEEQLSTWRRGVVMADGYRTAPAEVTLETGMGKGAWLRVIMREGRKRQIRETGTLLGLPVVKIIRVRIGTVQLGGLKPREWRFLSPQEVASLKGKPGAAVPAKRAAGKAGNEQKTRSGQAGSTPARRPARPSRPEGPPPTGRNQGPAGKASRRQAPGPAGKPATRPGSRPRPAGKPASGGPARPARRPKKSS